MTDIHKVELIEALTEILVRIGGLDPRETITHDQLIALARKYCEELDALNENISGENKDAVEQFATIHEVLGMLKPQIIQAEKAIKKTNHKIRSLVNNTIGDLAGARCNIRLVSIELQTDLPADKKWIHKMRNKWNDQIITDPTYGD